MKPAAFSGNLCKETFFPVSVQCNVTREEEKALWVKLPLNKGARGDINTVLINTDPINPFMTALCIYVEAGQVDLNSQILHLYIAVLFWAPPFWHPYNCDGISWIGYAQLPTIRNLYGKLLMTAALHFQSWCGIISYINRPTPASDVMTHLKLNSRNSTTF